MRKIITALLCASIAIVPNAAFAKKPTQQQIDRCVDKEVTKFKKWRASQGLDPVVRWDVLEEFEQDCKKQLSAKKKRK